MDLPVFCMTTWQATLAAARVCGETTCSGYLRPTSACVVHKYAGRRVAEFVTPGHSAGQFGSVWPWPCFQGSSLLQNGAVILFLVLHFYRVRQGCVILIWLGSSTATLLSPAALTRCSVTRNHLREARDRETGGGGTMWYVYKKSKIRRMPFNT